MARTRTIDEFTKPTGTIIGKGLTIQAARFSCNDSESMRIDGTVVGDIAIEGVINISDTGHVDGNVVAGSVRVAGRVTGNLQCRQAIHLTPTADVMGDIRAAIIIVDNGAILVGRCQTDVSVDNVPTAIAYTSEQAM